MRILLPVDGSAFTKKALAFVMVNPELLGDEHELHVLHVQPPMPPRVKSVVGAKIVNDYYAEESEKVIGPIRRFMKKHEVKFTADWLVGSPATEIVNTAKREKSHLIVMGTHGHGLLGRALMGSIAQRVLTDSPVPVLLVK